MLALLLDLGLDPDESGRIEGVEEVVPTSGEPLRACAIEGRLEMAGILLAHGANANTNVYAASSAMYEAHKRRDESMKALLEKHGGRLSAVAVAELDLVEHAARLLAEDAEGRTADGIAGPASSVAQDLLWGAIGCPSPRSSSWRSGSSTGLGMIRDGTAFWKTHSTCGRRAIALVTSTRLALYWTGAIRMCEAGGERRCSMRSRRRAAGSRPPTGSLHVGAARSRRARRRPRRVAPEHAARLGVPLGTGRDGEAPARARGGSDRSRRGTVGGSCRVGGKDGPPGDCGAPGNVPRSLNGSQQS